MLGSEPHTQARGDLNTPGVNLDRAAIFRREVDRGTAEPHQRPKADTRARGLQKVREINADVEPDPGF